MEAQKTGRRPRASFRSRGVQYTAISFGKRLEEVGIVPSMGRTATALDNAMAESFIATLKAELVHRDAAFPIERQRGAPSLSTWKGFTTDAGCIRL